MNQIQKLLIMGLFLAVSFTVCVGRPKSEAKAMKEFADALIQEVINQSFEEMATAQKDCTGKKKGWYKHMHNCKKASGKCCSENEDGTDGTRCDDSQTECGYCF